MTAEVIALPVNPYPPREPTRLERMRERARDLRGEAVAWIESKTIDKSPVVLVRRNVMYDRERAAFELGRDCRRHLTR